MIKVHGTSAHNPRTPKKYQKNQKKVKKVLDNSLTGWYYGYVERVRTHTGTKTWLKLLQKR